MIGNCFFAGDAGKRQVDIVLGYATLLFGNGAELFEDAGGLLNGVFVPLDANATVAGRNLDAQRRADFPQMLIARAKKREESLGIEKRNSSLCHSARRGGPE